MKSSLQFLSLALSFGSIALSQQLYEQPCLFASPVYPAPSDLASSASVQNAIGSLDEAVADGFSMGATFGQLNNATSFSIEVYSLQDEQPLYTHHFSSSKLQGTPGTTQVDSNTVYRLGSVSKLWTAYIYLLAAGDISWNQAITKFVPELAQYAKAHAGSSDRIDYVSWDEITVGALVSHLAGIGRDAAPGVETDAQLATLGLPRVPAVGGNFCGDPEVVLLPCERKDFFTDYLSRHPVVSAYSTPIYSNAAFYPVQLALERITGKDLKHLFASYLILPLGLKNTYSIPPTEDVYNQSVIPVNASASRFKTDLHYATAAGGYYSTLNEVTKVGKSILNSTFLTAAQTRKWMKPGSVTSNPKLLVGSPWEVYKSPLANQTRWMYTKSGDIGLYSSYMILLPEYGVGMTILGAGPASNANVRILSDILSTTIVPALEAAAVEQAATSLAGTYADAATNSSLTLTATSSGLSITAWTFGGMEALPLLGQFYGPDGTSNSTFQAHLYPTGLRSPTDKSLSFRAVYQHLPQQRDPGPFSSNCIS